MSLESCQRRFTKRIEGLVALSYNKRLSELGLTTLLERRARGDLIETYKILNGFVNYGHSMFRSSRSGRHLLHTTSFSINGDIFKRRAIRYWNMLPVDVKEAISINDFKDKLKKKKLYRDDGLAAINTTSGRLGDKARKYLIRIFESFGLKITALANLRHNI